jgi:spermidine synthase
VTRVLERRQTRFQTLVIADTEAYGRVLLLDGQLQSSERDEFIYHEALVHPAMLLHPEPAQVLILGGGEGATLREVLAHESVREARMVDIDGEVVAACRTHLPMFGRGSFEDPRARLVIDDARRDLERGGARYDVILQDLTDPDEEGPAAELFHARFFSLVASRLSARGLFVVQCGSASVTRREELLATLDELRGAFAHVAPYLAFVPSFAAPWSFALAAPQPFTLLDPQTWRERLGARLRRPCRSLDGESLRAMFAWPPHLARPAGTA